MKIKIKFTALVLAAIFNLHLLRAQNAVPPASGDEAAALAKKLANPVASLISVPFQNNTDYGIGDAHGSRNTLNFQPVIPITLSPKLNLIARAIIPLITQYDVNGEGTKNSGLGDAVLSAFFSPSQGKIIWGVGPVFLVPIATDNLLGTKKFGVGPTAVVLKQTASGFTLGGLANQIWSVAGDKERSEVSQLYVQPFINYNWKSGAGVGLSGEITQNWQENTTTATLIPTVSGVTKLGKQIISIVVGPRIPLAAPNGTKPVFGFRGVLIFVFPK